MKRWQILLAAPFALVGAAALFAGGGATWLLRSSLADLDGEVTLEALEAPVTIDRDVMGVPTIRATNVADLARAIGFLHGQERFFQMDLQRRSAAGELSAVFGAGALEMDKSARVHRFRTVAQDAVEAMSPEKQRLLQAYADGVNAGLSALGTAPPEYLLVQQDPEPWLPEDTVLTQVAMYQTLQPTSGEHERTVGLLHDTLPEALVAWLHPRGDAWDAPMDGSVVPPPPMPGPEVVDLRTGVLAPPGPLRDSPTEDHADAVAPGSNSWVVAGSHTASGAAMMANDMHLPISVPNIWYRARLIVGDIDAVGVTLPGAGALVVGSNGHVAWGFTNSYGDFSDVVLLETDPSGQRYRTPDGYETIVRHRETIEVKDTESVTIEVPWTRWGPVLGRDHRGRMWAYRWVAHDGETQNVELIDMMEARSLDEALAVAHRSGIPTQNIVIADNNGDIAWTVAGKVPVRQGFDGTVPTSWADHAGWTGWREPTEIPVIRNPKGGKLWTANSRMVGGDAYAVLGDGGYVHGARGHQIMQGLAPLDDVTPADLFAVQLDDRALFLERWRRLLSQSTDDPAVTAVLDRWTGRADPADPAYPLVRAFRHETKALVLEPLLAPARAADPRFPFSSLRQTEHAVWQMLTERPAHLLHPSYPSWDAVLEEGVRRAVARINEVGALGEVTWGRYEPVAIRHPVSLAAPQLSEWIDMPTVGMYGDIDMPRVQLGASGASQRIVVSPGREEEGIFHMPTGQSGHPLSPFYGLGHEDWVEGRATPLMPGPTEWTLTLQP